MMRHLDLVDIYWFSVVLQGKPMPPKWADADWDADPDWEMASAVDFTLDEITTDLIRESIDGSAGD